MSRSHSLPLKFLQCHSSGATRFNVLGSLHFCLLHLKFVHDACSASIREIGADSSSISLNPGNLRKFKLNHPEPGKSAQIQARSAWIREIGANSSSIILNPGNRRKFRYKHLQFGNRRKIRYGQPESGKSAQIQARSSCIREILPFTGWTFSDQV